MFVGLYSVDGLVPMPPGKHDPITGQDVSRLVSADGAVSSLFYYSLTKTKLLAECEGKLFIEWNNPISWAQWAKQDKACGRDSASKGRAPLSGVHGISCNHLRGARCLIGLVEDGATRSKRNLRSRVHEEWHAHESWKAIRWFVLWQ
jgi:hypothetical protein